mmetsp:Transcript_13778/g.24893  ORF Transcript_13778/g.24893 Transcript_13778/m.24893 type:complete len:101 (-) Transcript_13778:756-1058(-)
MRLHAGALLFALFVSAHPAQQVRSSQATGGTKAQRPSKPEEREDRDLDLFERLEIELKNRKKKNFATTLSRKTCVFRDWSVCTRKPFVYLSTHTRVALPV